MTAFAGKKAELAEFDTKYEQPCVGGCFRYANPRAQEKLAELLHTHTKKATPEKGPTV